MKNIFLKPGNEAGLFTKILTVSFCLLLSPLLITCNQQADHHLPPQNSSSSLNIPGGVNLDLSKLIAENDKLQREEIVLEWDEYFKERKKYAAYPLVQVLDSVLRNHQLDKENTIITFDCIDGYRPSLPLSQLYGNIQGYLVDVTGSDSFPHKFRPFYLVWKGPKSEIKEYPWPYGLSGLQLIPASDVFKAIKPAGADKSPGYQLFYNNCLKCHSLNKIGGAVGPELNVPKNITEYWTERDIVSFCRNPASYRYNSTMPPITNLSDKELAQIVSYLKYMKGHKTPAK